MPQHHASRRVLVLDPALGEQALTEVTALTDLGFVPAVNLRRVTEPALRTAIEGGWDTVDFDDFAEEELALNLEDGGRGHQALKCRAGIPLTRNVLGRATAEGVPGVILAVTPKSETSSAMSFNYVVRSVGYALGSAIGGLILAAGTGPGHLFPDDSAYTTAALVGIGAMAITTLTNLALARRRSSETNP